MIKKSASNLPNSELQDDSFCGTNKTDDGRNTKYATAWCSRKDLAMEMKDDGGSVWTNQMLKKGIPRSPRR